MGEGAPVGGERAGGRRGPSQGGQTRRAVEQTVPAPRKHPLAVSVSETRGAPPPHPRPASAPRFAASGRAGRGEEWV